MLVKIRVSTCVKTLRRLNCLRIPSFKFQVAENSENTVQRQAIMFSDLIVSSKERLGDVIPSGEKRHLA